MGCTHGKMWTQEKITAEIISAMNKLEIDRMPTVSELKNINMNGLSCAISKSHGFEWWAEALKLPVKTSETGLGKKYEKIFADIVYEKLQYETQQMSMRFPYDVLVEDLVKVDVKCGFAYTNSNVCSFYTFNLETTNRKSDFLVCFCLNKDKSIHKTYVIPAIVMQGKSQLSVGIVASKYDKCIDRYDLITDYLNLYQGKLKELAYTQATNAIR